MPSMPELVVLGIIYPNCGAAMRRGRRPIGFPMVPAPRQAGDALKLHADRPSHLNTVTAYGPGYIEVNGIRFPGHLILLPEGPVRNWEVAGFDALRAEDFEALHALGVELVLLGTGERQRFAAPRLTSTLARARVAVESMDTRAACRTFNILAADGRRVAGAFLQESISP
jgi:uncharacterized protein